MKQGNCNRCEKEIEVNKHCSLDKIFCDECRKLKATTKRKKWYEKNGSQTERIDKKYDHLHSKHKGSIAEMKVVSDLIVKGYEVAVPFGDLLPIDLVVIDPKSFKIKKVQVKWCQLRRNGTFGIELRNSTSNKTLTYTKKYTEEEIDIFAVYVPDLDECFYIPSKECLKRKCAVSLRVKPQRGKNRPYLKTEDYTNFPMGS